MSSELGESGGRSAGNRPRTSARRRFTADERAERVPQHDDPQQWPDAPRWRMTRRGWIVATLAGIALLVALEIATRDWCWYGGCF